MQSPPPSSYLHECTNLMYNVSGDLSFMNDSTKQNVKLNSLRIFPFPFNTCEPENVMNQLNTHSEARSVLVGLCADQCLRRCMIEHSHA